MGNNARPQRFTPVFLFNTQDVEEYCRANGWKSRELGSGDAYRERLYDLARARRGPSWMPPKHPTSEARKSGPWDHFLWESLFELNQVPVAWPVVLDALKPYKSLIVIFEAPWLPAFEVEPIDGEWRELTDADIYFFTTNKQLVMAIDHEYFGPFLGPDAHGQGRSSGS